jgi:hypothetical protein
MHGRMTFTILTSAATVSSLIVVVLHMLLSTMQNTTAFLYNVVLHVGDNNAFMAILRPRQ